MSSSWQPINPDGIKKKGLYRGFSVYFASYVAQVAEVTKVKKPVISKVYTACDCGYRCKSKWFSQSGYRWHRGAALVITMYAKLSFKDGTLNKQLQ